MTKVKSHFQMSPTNGEIENEIFAITEPHNTLVWRMAFCGVAEHYHIYFVSGLDAHVAIRILM